MTEDDKLEFKRDILQEIVDWFDSEPDVQSAVESLRHRISDIDVEIRIKNGTEE